MKISLVFFVSLFSLCFQALSFSTKEEAAKRLKDSAPLSQQDTSSLFAFFKKSFNKSYSPSEERFRLEVFEKNVQSYHEHNLNEAASYTLGITKFTDLTQEEFDQTILMDTQDCSATTTRDIYQDALRERTGARLGDSNITEPLFYVDWRNLGIVSQVKDQGNCGSCWTFASTGALESHLSLLTHNTPMNLSEQQLVDCAGDYECAGCNGCLPSKAFEYIKYNGGLDIEEFYPYLARNGSSCKYNPLGVGVTLTGGSFNITAYDEQQLQDIVTYVGPVTISFNANRLGGYTSGVFTGYNATDGSQCPQGYLEVNHAVLVVGTGVDSDSGLPYWIIKNSWGTDWGMDGYFWMYRGNNTCGIADCASYPLITGDIPYVPTF